VHTFEISLEYKFNKLYLCLKLKGEICACFLNFVLKYKLTKFYLFLYFLSICNKVL
jgi:hypothetical protein